MKNGFSLIELLLVLGLISLLAAMAYPNYTHLLVRTRRLEAETALLNLANRLEQGDPHTLSQTQLLTRWYDINIRETKNKHDSYTLTAMPLGSQGMQDTQCQALTLTREGIEGMAEGPKGQPTGLVELCWN
tara:strand:+ start:12978 stop:13370 length:393 start_codon:yes stop_codon:yes gene_type:complete